MPDYTLTYSPDVQGWPSFYSFHPDFMIGMNNYFYSFKGGNLYRHNTNDTRNQFYGTNYPSTVKSVFNGNPTENTLWKTIELESDNAWATQLQTNIQSGAIASAYYKKKEAVWFKQSTLRSLCFALSTGWVAAIR
jgi:V8-like Glu-specific endopeptidase